MRRYGDTSNNLAVPGRNVGLKLRMHPRQPVASPCAPNPTALLWFSDASGDFTETSEAAYLGGAESPGPVLAVARVLGDTCGAVTWTVTWTPDGGTGGDPATVENGPDLYVYPATGGGPGQLSVSATCAGRTFGPILLTLLLPPSSGGAWARRFGPEYWTASGAIAWMGGAYRLNCNSGGNLFPAGSWVNGYQPTVMRLSIDTTNLAYSIYTGSHKCSFSGDLYSEIGSCKAYFGIFSPRKNYQLEVPLAYGGSGVVFAYLFFSAYSAIGSLDITDIEFQV